MARWLFSFPCLRVRVSGWDTVSVGVLKLPSFSTYKARVTWRSHAALVLPFCSSGGGGVATRASLPFGLDLPKPSRARRTRPSSCRLTPCLLSSAATTSSRAASSRRLSS